MTTTELEQLLTEKILMRYIELQKHPNGMKKACREYDCIKKHVTVHMNV